MMFTTEKGLDSGRISYLKTGVFHTICADWQNEAQLLFTIVNQGIIDGVLTKQTLIAEDEELLASTGNRHI